jgi:hypothetical protein
MSESYWNLRLDDINPDQTTALVVCAKNEDDDGLAISLGGHSTKTSLDGFDDAVLFLELKDGKPTLYVWADINDEDPTHTIDLSGAHVSRRISE